MPLRTARRKFLQALLAGCVPPALTGCGTIFFPERRGQPAGPLDWRIVALDALGLFFFFIPGIIAFAVDFTTGAIYLPPHEYGSTPPEPHGTFVTLRGKFRSLEDVEQRVSRETGKNVRSSRASTTPSRWNRSTSSTTCAAPPNRRDVVAGILRMPSEVRRKRSRIQAAQISRGNWAAYIHANDGLRRVRRVPSIRLCV